MSAWFEIEDKPAPQKPIAEAEVTPDPLPPESQPETPRIEDPDLVEFEVVEDLYSWIEGTRVPAPSFREECHHVSQLVSLCSRKVVFAEVFPEMDKPEPISATNQLTWDFGTATHRWWQEEYFGPMGWLIGSWLCSRCGHVVRGKLPRDPCSECGWLGRENGVASSCEESCRWPGGYQAPDRHCSLKCKRWGSWRYLEPRVMDDDLELVGSCDGILELPPKYALDRVALEIKTITKSYFDRLTGPTRAHVFQLNTYMHFLELTHGLFLYIHKGEYDDAKGNKPRAYLVEYDPDLASEAIRRIRDWQEAEKTGNLGRRICPGIDSWQAKRCPFYDVCYLEDIDENVKSLRLAKAAD